MRRRGSIQGLGGAGTSADVSTPETIAIIGGTGAMGQGLAYRWARAGYRVVIGSRDRDSALGAAHRLKARVPEACVSGETNREAAASADIVVLTVPHAHHAATLQQIATCLAGKLLIDTTVPLQPPPDIGRVSLPKAGSAALETRALVAANVDVVAAFHNVSAPLLNSEAPIDCDVLVAGDKPAARQRVVELAAAAGLRAWHAGPLENAAAAETLTPVLIQVNKRYGYRATGIRLVPASRANPASAVPDRLELVGLSGMPAVHPGDDLAELIWQSLTAGNLVLADGDILVVAQKVVSKAEGRLVRLDSVVPSDEAQQLAARTGKDAELVQLILNESSEVLREKTDVIVVEHRSGVVMANAGIDRSNVPEGYASLLPEDSDRSARQLREGLAARSRKQIAVIVSDSIGRAWRIGTVGHALGVAGLDPLVDLRGHPDILGRPLQVTQVAVADGIAAAAVLVMGEADEAKPVVLVRGYPRSSEHVGVSPLLREKQEDLFR